MGSTKVQETSTTQTQPTPTPEETEMNKLRLQQFRETVGPQTQTQLAGLNLIQQLLTGTQALPGFFGTMAQGISPTAIGEQATNMALGAIPGFQGMGLADSGVMAKSISKDIANNLLFPAEQFNIGNLQNLMNLALSGQAQVQQPITAGTTSLGAQLAGLRSITQTGQTTQTRNPFLENFYDSTGTTLGGGRITSGSGWFGI